MQIKLPEYRENNPGRTLRQIHSWLYQLNEQLRYLFSHLDEDNFSESFLSASLGETKALKTRVKDLEAPLKWVPLALTGVTSWSDDDAPMIGRAHGTVFLRGAVKLNKALADRKVLDIGQVDELYRPPIRTALAVPTDEGLVRLTIQKDGGIRLRNDSGGEMPATAFISLACAYRAREE